MLIDSEFGEAIARFYAENELERTEWLNELISIKEKINQDNAAREGIFGYSLHPVHTLDGNMRLAVNRFYQTMWQHWPQSSQGT